MKTETIPRVYARALFDLSVEKDQLEAVHEEVLFLQKLLAAEPLMGAFVESPSIEIAEKEKVLSQAFRGKLSDVLVNFILVVVKRSRQLQLGEMLQEFQSLHDERIGLVHAEAVSAVTLSPESHQQLQRELEKKLKKQVLVQNVVDPSILGGLMVRFGGMVADGSIKTALKVIETKMREVKFGSEFVHED
jgi:F-type H+-transporting ATPase subunit delta